MRWRTGDAIVDVGAPVDGSAAVGIPALLHERRMLE